MVFHAILLAVGIVSIICVRGSEIALYAPTVGKNIIYMERYSESIDAERAHRALCERVAGGEI